MTNESGLRPEQVQAIRDRMLRAVESEPGDFQCAKGEECEVCDGVLAVRQGAELLAALLADREQREGEIERVRREAFRAGFLALLERNEEPGEYGIVPARRWVFDGKSIAHDLEPSAWEAWEAWQLHRAALAVAPKEESESPDPPFIHSRSGFPLAPKEEPR